MNYASTTQVGVDRSRNEIEKILMRYGASEFGYMRREKHILIGFRAANRNIRFVVEAPDKEMFKRTEKGRHRKSDLVDQAYEQAVRQRWRALVLVIKAKLEAVESGIATFEEEFLPYIVLPSGRTVAEETIPLIEQAYQTGKDIPLLKYEGRIS
jgi:hypothetical protein